jgi:hypothetical protein
MLYDTEAEGLETVYAHYQAELMRYVIASKTPVSTKQAYEAMKTRGVKSNSGSLSRAAVINFLAAQAEAGLLELGDKTGKGGHHALYSANYLSRDEATLRRSLKTRLIESMEKQLGD